MLAGRGRGGKVSAQPLRDRLSPLLLPDLIVPFKKRVYRSVLEEFRELI
mgnify:CR=1 FL=1